MRTGSRGSRGLVGLAGCCLLAVTACASPGHATNAKIGVVAGENFWGNIAAQIGGERAAVTSLIGAGGADPHEYDADVQDAATLADAKVVLVNGLGYDDFLRKLLAASPSGKREVLTVSDIVGVSGGNANPHLWYGPGYVITAARAMAAAFAKVSPAGAGTFQANLRAFLTGEQQVVDVVNRIKAKHAGTEVAYTERVPGYLLDAADLRLGTPESFSQSIEDGYDPSPSDDAAFEKALTEHTVKVLIYNSQVTDAATKHVRELALRAGVPVVGMTETLPATEPDFQTWQADQARALLAALGG
jgi:zinc/manganese transport system substrate-binding protein